MAKWIKAAREDEFNRVKGVTIGDKKIALFKLEGKVYALNNVCSHEYTLLTEGDIFEDEVYCPLHGSPFDIRTGEVRGLPATEPVDSYPVKIEDGDIFVNLKGG